ncbi:MAG: hypothetical protein QM492_12360 [Rhodobacterales bacterium]
MAMLHFDRHTFEHGCAFLEASYLINATGYHSESLVRAVNQIFAIEIFLKSMLVKIKPPQQDSLKRNANYNKMDNRILRPQRIFPKNGHNLFIVFEKLDSSLKSKLNSSYSNNHSETLSEALGKIGDAFTIIRYAYEDRKEPFQFSGIQIEEIANFLMKFISEEQN